MPILNADLSLGKLSDSGMRSIDLPKCLGWAHAQYSYRSQFFIKYALSAFTFLIITFASTQIMHAEDKWFNQCPLYFWCSFATFSLHQIKRCIEVLFIHSYSHDTMHFGTGCFMIFHYFIMALSIGYGHIANNLSSEQLNDAAPVYVGFCVWLFGERPRALRGSGV